MVNDNGPIISVCMITYGHEEFIGQAIESVLNQETSFLIELIIVNDNSYDNTDFIIKQIIKEHPKGNLITYYCHEKNLGMLDNFAYALNICKGKYIALCEGDDYWISKNKIQIQAEFLEQNQDFILTGYNAKINSNGIELEKLVRSYNDEYTDFNTSDFIIGNPFVTCTVMFRNIGFKNIDNLFDKFIVGDWPLFTMLSFKGKCRFFSEPKGVYRKHPNSVTSNNRAQYLPYRNEFINRINHAIFWNNYSGKMYDFEKDLIVEKRSRHLTNIALRNMDFKTAIYYSEFINTKKLNKLHSRLIARCLKLMNWLNIM